MGPSGSPVDRLPRRKMRRRRDGEGAEARRVVHGLGVGIEEEEVGAEVGRGRTKGRNPRRGGREAGQEAATEEDLAPLVGRTGEDDLRPQDRGTRG